MHAFSSSLSFGLERKHQKRIIVLSFLLLILLGPLNYAAESPIWSGVERIVVVSDIHGDYDNFREIIKGIEIIDDNLNWNGGKTHLVQTGDILDRGPDAKKVFDLLMKLEKQAEMAGGKVHILLGNHEEINIIGFALESIGYVHPEQFSSFLPDKYRQKRENAIRAKFLTNQNSKKGLKQEINKFWSEIMKIDLEAQEMYNTNFYREYGKWLLEKNVVIKINDIVFTHGGISEEYSKWKLKDINSRVRREMLAFIRGEVIPLRIVYQQDSPQWFRGLIMNDEVDYSDNVDRILESLDAQYMVVGHTVRTQEVLDSKRLDRFQGRIWGMDTGISDYYGGPLNALIIENGKFKIWWRNNEK